MLRLQNATDFERVRRDGRSHAHPLVVLITYRSEQSRPRCGFAASKAIGTAVARNRAKRLLREAVRARAKDLAPGWDLVFIARQPLAKATFGQAVEAVAAVLRRANVLKSNA